MGGEGSRVSPLLKQIWTVAGVLLCTTAAGMAQGYMSVLLVALRKPDSPIKVDVHMASWLASAMPMSTILGTISFVIFMDIFGRKIAFILEVLPGVTAMLLIYSASDYGTLVAARIIDGITAGGAVTLGAVIIGEYTSPAHRGLFLNLKTACLSLGSTTVHSIGHFFHWKTVALIVLIPYAAALIIVLTWPESPAWLASKKKFKEAERAFIWLRGDSEETRAELNNLIKAQEERTTSQFKLNVWVKIKIFFSKLRRKDFVYPVFIMICSCALFEVSGRHLIPAYSSDIIGGIVGNPAQSFYYTLAVDLIVTISCTCSSMFIKLLKTRTLLFSSGISSLVVLTIACLYLFLASNSMIPIDRPWVPLSMFIVYFIFVNLGCTPIPLALGGEIIPLEHKSYCILAYSVFASVFMISTLKIFPYMLLSLHIYGTFAVLGLLMATILTVLYFTLPETKNRTLQDIEDDFKVRNKDCRDEECTKMLHLNV